MNRKPILTILSMILILAFVLTGCSGPSRPRQLRRPRRNPPRPGCARTHRAPAAAPGTDRSPAAPEPTAAPARRSRPRRPNPPRFLSRSQIQRSAHARRPGQGRYAAGR